MCYGDVCTQHTLFDPATGVKTAERWRCSNDSEAVCNISSTLLRIECCDTHDFCNFENHTLEEDTLNRTSNFSCEMMGNFPANNDSSTDYENSTSNCTELVDNETTPISIDSPSPGKL